MPIFRRVLLSLSLFLIASCIESSNPVTDPALSTVDKNLVGVWKAKSDNGDVIYLHLGLPQGKLAEHFLQAMQVNHDAGHGLSNRGTDWRLVFISKLGSLRYFNSVVLKPEEIRSLETTGWKPTPDTKYDIFRYDFSGNTMKVYVPEQNVLKKAIASHALRGEDQKLGGVKITDSSANLARFLEKENKNLFPTSKPPMIFNRVK